MCACLVEMKSFPGENKDTHRQQNIGRDKIIPEENVCVTGWQDFCQILTCSSSQHFFTAL